jgi:hypothetical protein
MKIYGLEVVREDGKKQPSETLLCMNARIRMD